MKIALYCRVSTEMQGDAKTVERQLYELRNYAKQKGYKIVREYKDVISGTIMKRLELDQLKEDAKSRMFELVLVSEVSRISRGQDAIVDVILFERELEKSGVQVHFLDGSSDNEIVKSVRAIIAKTERADFIKRSTNGRLARAKRGSALGGITSYGYRYISKQINGFRGGIWEIEQEEAKTVNLIMDLYIQLQSQKTVLRELANRGIKARSGNYWRSSSLRHILENETYATGTTYYKDNPISVPVILSKEKWDLVQKILKERSNKHLKQKDSQHILGGLVRCNSCGATYSGEWCKGKRYYRCNNRHATFPNPRTCTAKMVLADKLESKVWDAVSYLLEHPDILQQRIDYLNKDDKELENNLDEEKTDLNKKLADILKKKKKFLDLYGEELMSKDDLLAKVGEVSKEEEVLKEQLAAIENRLLQISTKPALIKNVKDFCAKAKVQMGLFTFEEKRDFLRLVIRGIKYDYFKDKAGETFLFIDGEIPIKAESKEITFNTPESNALVGTNNHNLISYVLQLL